jgi:hypothetical protein
MSHAVESRATNELDDEKREAAATNDLKLIEGTGNWSAVR